MLYHQQACETVEVLVEVLFCLMKLWLLYPAARTETVGRLVVEVAAPLPSLAMLAMLRQSH